MLTQIGNNSIDPTKYEKKNNTLGDGFEESLSANSKLRSSLLQCEGLREIAQKWKMELDELREFSDLEYHEMKKKSPIKTQQYVEDTSNLTNVDFKKDWNKLKRSLIDTKLEMARFKCGYNDIKEYTLHNLESKNRFISNDIYKAVLIIDSNNIHI